MRIPRTGDTPAPCTTQGAGVFLCEGRVAYQHHPHPHRHGGCINPTSLTMLDYHHYETSISPFFLPHLEANNPRGNNRGVQVGISAIARPGGNWVEVAIVIGGAIQPGGRNNVGATLIDPHDYNDVLRADMDEWGGDQVLRMHWEDYGKALAYLTDPGRQEHKYGHSAITYVACVLNHYPAQRALAEECGSN